MRPAGCMFETPGVKQMFPHLDENVAAMWVWLNSSKSDDLRTNAFSMIKTLKTQEKNVFFICWSPLLRHYKWGLYILSLFPSQVPTLVVESRMLVVASGRQSCSIPPAIRFLFLDFTSFIVENVFSHVCISKTYFRCEIFQFEKSIFTD